MSGNKMWSSLRLLCQPQTLFSTLIENPMGGKALEIWRGYPVRTHFRVLGLTVALVKLMQFSFWHVPRSATCDEVLHGESQSACHWIDIPPLSGDMFAWVGLWSHNTGIQEKTHHRRPFEKSLAIPILVRYQCSSMRTEKRSRGRSVEEPRPS